MRRSIVQKLRRLTYRQWAAIGFVLLIAICTFDSWRLYSRVMAFHHFSRRVGTSIQRNKHGPEWLRSRVPAWVRENVLETPHAVWIQGNSPDADERLADLRSLPTVRSLTVLGSKRESKAVSNADADKWHRQAALIGRLTQLHRLSLNVSDADLNELAKLTELRQLDLDGDRLSGAALRALIPMRNLRELVIKNANDDSLSGLAEMPGLEILDLSQTDITDEGLKHLEGHPRLFSLKLASTNIADYGLHSLATLTSLTSLDLQSTKISDEGLPSLARLPRLQFLKLGGTAITDASIPQLIQMPSLRLLSMVGSSVTVDGYLQYARACPNVTLPMPYRF